MVKGNAESIQYVVKIGMHQMFLLACNARGFLLATDKERNNERYEQKVKTSHTLSSSVSVENKSSVVLVDVNCVSCLLPRRVTSWGI